MASAKKETTEDKTNAGGIRTDGAGKTNDGDGEAPEGLRTEAAFFEELVAQRMLSCVEDLGKKFGRNKLVGILIGVASNYIIESAKAARPHYGTLARFSRKEVTYMLDQLISRGYLRVEGGEFPLLHLTDEGMEALRDGSGARVRLPIRLEPKMVPVPADGKLYDRVRELRARLARQEDLPVYCIFNNRVLLELVENRPMDMDALGGVWGFSDVRLKKYGQDVVELMQDYAAQENGPVGGGDDPHGPAGPDCAGTDVPDGDDIPPRTATRGGAAALDDAADFRTAAQIARDSGLV